MATSPSQKWKDGVLVERAIETNRWKVKPDGSPVGEEAEPKEKSVDTKAVVPVQAENKGMRSGATK